MDATTLGLPAVASTGLAQGRFLNAATAREPVAVLGAVTAFARKKDPTVSAGLIIRRVRDLNGKGAAGPDEMFPGLALPRLRRLTVRSHPGPNPMVR